MIYFINKNKKNFCLKIIKINNKNIKTKFYKLIISYNYIYFINEYIYFLKIIIF